MRVVSVANSTLKRFSLLIRYLLGFILAGQNEEIELEITPDGSTEP
ncbi:MULTISPECIES: hypothetical protein [unclassified Nostoc]|nr:MULTISPECIES: hypothetical protein [unclassified Nostoc]MDZ8032369.1 hypothetical protein [Nostoc sp. DedSLP04]MDZ8092793.1 hypothetical protein [Nostoc sp. DedQUE05]